MSIIVNNNNKLVKTNSTTTGNVQTPDKKQNKTEVGQELKQSANAYGDVPESELTIIKEIVEDKIEEIEKGVKKFSSEQEKKQELNIYKQELKRINAEFERRANKPKINIKS